MLAEVEHKFGCSAPFFLGISQNSLASFYFILCVNVCREEEKISAWKHMHKVWDSCEDESRTCH